MSLSGTSPTECRQAPVCPLGEQAVPVSRRDFLLRLAGLSAALSLAGLLAPIARYVYPTLRAAGPQRQKIATVGQIGSLPAALDFDYLDVPCTLLQVAPGRLVGLSRICTHLGCVVKWEPTATEFHCPCHAGFFAPSGEVISGPPPRPLPRLKVSVQGENVWVDGWEPND